MKHIKIIGAGWYGCYIATKLIELGHEVEVFERNSTIFSGASSVNQSRLHLGFHYPRSAITRANSIEDAKRFLISFKDFTQEIPCNIYAVAEDLSLIDWTTYKQIMSASGLTYVELEAGDHGLTNLEGAMITGERLILQNKAKAYFETALNGCIHLNCSESFSQDPEIITINTTYGGLSTELAARYEPCLLFIYSGPQTHAVTVMDGPFGTSLYPYYESGFCSLTSVEHTPLGRYSSYYEAYAAMNDKDFPANVEINRGMMEDRISKYVPWFKDCFKYHGFDAAIRSLPLSAADRRTHHVSRRGNIISVLPGKISSVMNAAEAVLDEVCKMEQ